MPVPNDPRVRICVVPERLAAVHRYSGSCNESNYARHENLLLDALADDGMSARSAPVSARYNNPFTPRFMRRNEVIVEIEEGERPASGK